MTPSGTSSLHAESHPHAMWVMSRPGHPAASGPWRASASTRSGCQRRRRDLAGEVPLEAGRSACTRLVWEEAQMPAASIPTSTAVTCRRHRGRRLPASGTSACRSCPTPRTETFQGIDLLDPTKIVPEELAPVQTDRPADPQPQPDQLLRRDRAGRLPPGHLVPGIEFTDDPLLHAPLFSYLDTQLTRLGGPNFTQIPINRPLAPVNDNLRDGFNQQAVHRGQAPYTPNRVDAAARSRRSRPRAAYVALPPARRGGRRPGGAVVLRRPLQPGDDVLPSLTSVEQEHIVDAFTFELGKCYEQGDQRAHAHRARQARRRPVRAGRPDSACRPRRRSSSSTSPVPGAAGRSSPPFPIAGRVVGVVAGPRADLAGIGKLRTALEAEGPCCG